MYISSCNVKKMHHIVDMGFIIFCLKKCVTLNFIIQFRFDEISARIRERFMKVRFTAENNVKDAGFNISFRVTFLNG